MKNKSIGAAAIIVDREGKLLLVQHTYGRRNWELPGGAAEINESPLETAQREVWEETGLAVVAHHMTGMYYDPAGDFLHLVFWCRPQDTEARPRPDLQEIAACRFWLPDALPRPISDFTVRRIHDAVAGVALPLPDAIRPRVWLE